MRTPILTALVAGVVFVAGCGGGGSNSDVQPDSTSDSVVEPTPTPPKPVTTSQATIQGTSEVDIIDYLMDNASGGPWGPDAECPGSCWHRHPQLPLWEGRPIVRVWSNATADQHRMVASAVDLINDWLPLDHRMRIGAPTSLRTEDPVDVPAGEINVTFDYDRDGGQSRYNESGDHTHSHDVPRMVSNLVLVDPNSSWHRTYGLIVHELVHAMGIPGPVSEYRHPTSIMPDGAYMGDSLPDEAGLPRLPRIDGEALMTAYEVYHQGEDHNDIHPESLGPWAATIPALHGEVTTDGGTARFGVEHRRQWTRAWDEGQAPVTPLARSGLTGTATWTGEMVGFTDTGTAVEGDAGITVDIADMDGTAAFTDLMARGASWGPDLSTDIRVGGIIFADTGSDSRLEVEGQLRGSGHEAVTGVLRWEDTATGNLTGAFGARRDEP